VQKEDGNTKRKMTSNRKRVSAKQPILNLKTCKEGQTERLPRIKVMTIVTMGPDNNAVENLIIGSVDGKNYPLVSIVNSRRHRRAKEGGWFVPGTEVFEVKSVSCIPNSGRVVACYSSKPKTNQADGDKELSLEQLYTFISQQEIRATSLQQEKKQEMLDQVKSLIEGKNVFVDGVRAVGWCIGVEKKGRHTTVKPPDPTTPDISSFGASARVDYCYVTGTFHLLVNPLY
jgi:hypothetical protein